MAEKSEKFSSGAHTRLRNFLVAAYLVLTFGAYFISVLLSRLERIKGFLGL